MKAEAPETYPMQFRDKIDEYLWKEHNIIGGCCSSIEEMKYSVAREVAEKLTDAFIEKACEWLKESVTNNPECNRTISKKGVITMGELIKDFRKYMEGE